MKELVAALEAERIEDVIENGFVQVKELAGMTAVNKNEVPFVTAYIEK